MERKREKGSSSVRFHQRSRALYTPRENADSDYIISIDKIELSSPAALSFFYVIVSAPRGRKVASATKHVTVTFSSTIHPPLRRALRRQDVCARGDILMRCAAPPEFRSELGH